MIEFRTCRELLSQPPQRWLIRGLIPEEAFTLLYGPSGEGKSFVALDWALCLATGTPWLGTYPTQFGTVVYVACEGAAGLPKRISAWLDAHPEITDPEHMLFLLTTLDVYDTDAVDEFFEALDERFPHEYMPHPETGEALEVISPGDVLRLVVIDTLARSYRGEDENSSAEMSEFIRRLEVFKEGRNTAVLLVHHASRHGGNERGSTALRAAMESVIGCHGTKSTVGPVSVLSRIDLINDKQKDDIEGSIVLRVERVEVPHLGLDDEGHVQTSLRLCLADPEESEDKVPGPPRPMRKQDMLGLLAVSEHGLTSSEWRIASQLKYRTFARRVERLRAEGIVERDEDSRRWSIVPEPADRPKTRKRRKT